MEEELIIAQDDSLLLKEDPNLLNGAAKELIKNAVIEVTIDDLSEGLIVVSFAHDDNLYQGVLLQLNRERGIPCGISFPKDYFTGALESREEQDPLQTPPLNQRHSYFQDRDGGWLDHLSSFKAGHGLRRVIKPPARFKNARSVRPRSRPVLCAKCKVLCDEKASTTPTDQSLSQAPEDELKKRAAVAASRAGGVTTRRGKSTMGVTSNTPLSSKDNEVNQDYSYVSVGSKDFIENYWKRPSLEPVLEDSNKIEGSSDTAGVPKLEAGLKDKLSNGVSGSKALSRVPKLKYCGESKLTITLSKDSTSKTLPTLIVSSVSGTVKTGKAKKSKEVKKLKKKKIPTDQGTAIASTQLDEEQVALGLEPHHSLIPQTSSSDSIAESYTSSTLHSDLVEHSKDQGISQTCWDSRIRKKSFVPIRFREDGKSSKRVFNFKRYRMEDKSLQEADDGNSLHESQSSHLNEEEFASQSQVSTSQPLFLPRTEGSSQSDSSVTSSTGLVSRDMSSSIEIESNASMSNTEGKTEPAKTPVIKICVGALMLKIPPKVKQEDHSNSDERAIRRAIKKAKKDARRKLSLSRESSPVATAVTLAPSPSPPLESPAPFPTCDLAAIGLNNDPLLLEADKSIVASHPKKKKKDKKRKRNRESHENGDEEDGEPGRCRPIIISTLPEPSLISPSISISQSVSPQDSQESIPKTAAQSSSATADGRQRSNSGSSLTETVPTTKRLCLSLKRLQVNSSSSWDIAQSSSPTETDSKDSESTSSSLIPELNDYPVNPSPSDELRDVNASSLDSYTDQDRDYVFKKGDIVWGKLPGCPWWPGKILDISFVDIDNVTASVSWYRASTMSSVKFSQLGPFEQEFETRYARSRRRGSYQHAVRDALIETHKLDPSDLPSD